MQVAVRNAQERRNGRKRFGDEESRERYRQKQERAKEIAKIISRMTAVEKAELLRRIGGVANIEGHKLSEFNTIFLFHQRHEVGKLSVVGGFKQWLGARRSVRKGEKGMMMVFPMVYGRKDANGEPIINPQTGVQDMFTRFRIGTVFDITQTEPLDPEVRECRGDMIEGEVIDV